jgi:hypothetical protein
LGRLCSLRQWITGESAAQAKETLTLLMPVSRFWQARRKNSSQPLFEIGWNQSTVAMLPINTALRPFGYLKDFILGIYASGSIHCLPFSP